MTASNAFAIASIGFDVKEQNVLFTLVTLAKNREPSFFLFEPTREKKRADILIVNADIPDAVQRWNAYLKLNKSKGTISSILVSEEAPNENTDEKTIFVKKPLVATRLLSLLETTVVKNHGYSPPQAFEGELDEEPANPEETTGTITALVVDDSLPVRIQMKKALANIAKTVDFAETGEEAEVFIAKNTYDIVFLDIILPGVDGYDICKLIKKDPEKGKTPVIMLTSNSSPADRIKGKMAGCDTYLIKPVRAEIFREVINEYLELED